MQSITHATILKSVRMSIHYIVKPFFLFVIIISNTWKIKKIRSRSYVYVFYTDLFTQNFNPHATQNAYSSERKYHIRAVNGFFFFFTIIIVYSVKNKRENAQNEKTIRYSIVLQLYYNIAVVERSTFTDYKIRR